MPAKFWRITAPFYESDYQHTYINGDAEHPYGLPGVDCEVCGNSYGGSRKLHIACPQSLRNHKHLLDPWPVSTAEHKLLQQEVSSELKKEGVNFTDFKYGDCFQPCYLDVPSKPRTDFLWSTIGSVIVSERVKLSLEKLNPDGIFFCEVNLRKIGKREARLPPPIPSTGEPEDMINEIPLLKKTDSLGHYFELIIRNESGLPPGCKPTKPCPECGYMNYGEERRFIMTDSMWQGADIFFLGTTCHIIVTDSLKCHMEKLKPTNIIFSDASIEE